MTLCKDTLDANLAVFQCLSGFQSGVRRCIWSHIYLFNMSELVCRSASAAQAHIIWLDWEQHALCME